MTLKRVVPVAAALTLALIVALFTTSQARAQSGPTVAPDLQSVGNFRPGPVDNNGDFRTFVDFNFDQQTFLTGGNRTSFGLVPVGGGDSVFGSDFIPSEQTDPTGDNTVTVLFNGQVTPADFARGFVSPNTVSSDPQGNAPLNIGQAEPTGANTSVNPDLRSVRIDCQQEQAFFTFDEPLTQEDVVQNTGGLRLYFNDTTNAGAQAVRLTDDPATLRAVFTDLPQGKTLSDAVGGYVTNGTVAGQPPSGPGGQAINQFDEIAPVVSGAGCGTTGGGTPGGGGSGGGAGDGGMTGGGNGTPGGGMQPGGGGQPGSMQPGGGTGGQSQIVNQSNTQSGTATGTATGSGSVVNNASNTAQQCQSGDQIQSGGEGNTQVDGVQCNQAINSVQAGGNARQIVDQSLGQNQFLAGVQ